MSSSRSEKSVRNIIFSLGGYFANLLLQLINRFVFIKFLATEYLGINGLFSGILSMLALSEMGVGTAIVFALYEPVAKKNVEKIKSLMQLYKTMYTIIGCFVLVVGAAITPFINIFIKDVPDIPLLKLYFLLYVINSGTSYFYSYKRSLIICNQDEYISTVTTTTATLLTKLSQIVILYLSHSYTLFLITQIVFTRLENIVISKIADRRFPYLKEKNVAPLTSEEKTGIKKNILAMMMHKIGDVVVNATDNLIVSKILGLVSVGLMSNYTMIIDVISSLTNKIFSSITASIGNLTVNVEKNHVEKVFYSILFGNFWFVSFSTISLYSLLGPFISLWLGDDYILPQLMCFALCGCFYLMGMRRSVLQFRTATGLFWNDRYKALIESAVNLAVSIPLTIWLGIAGVKIGTIISTIFTSFWIEGYILFKHYFNKSSVKYFLKQIEYLILTAGMCFVISAIYKFLPLPDSDIASFAIKLMICVIAPNVVYFLAFFRTDEFKYYSDMIRRKLTHKR